jgi:hypothetical protein
MVNTFSRSTNGTNGTGTNESESEKRPANHRRLYPPVSKSTPLRAHRAGEQATRTGQLERTGGAGPKPGTGRGPGAPRATDKAPLASPSQSLQAVNVHIQNLPTTTTLAGLLDYCQWSNSPTSAAMAARPVC